MDINVDLMLEEIASKFKAPGYYVENTLVHKMDGNRILGPLTQEQLVHMREKYESLMKSFPLLEEERYPFVVYKFIGKIKRIE